MGAEKVYIVCGCKPWCRKVFYDVIRRGSGVWSLVSDPEQLASVLSTFIVVEPDFIFFTHWNWKVPDEIISKFNCINFHMTDLPWGRGGSPLQNLIATGETETVITAHRMTSEIDSGEMYLKYTLSLNGTAEEVYTRAQYVIADMIKVLLDMNDANCFVPIPCGIQTPVVFRRRTPEQSELPVGLGKLSQVYDYIRMLDAETYPHAFVDVGKFRLELTGAVQYMDRVEARVVIKERA